MTDFGFGSAEWQPAFAGMTCNGRRERHFVAWASCPCGVGRTGNRKSRLAESTSKRLTGRMQTGREERAEAEPTKPTDKTCLGQAGA
jgi:hypothetical protein